MTNAVPSSSEGMQELLSNPDKVREFFSEGAVKNGDTKKFLDQYAALHNKQNPGTYDEVRGQIESVLFDMLRENGGGRKPAVDLANSISFRGGRPVVGLSPDGTAAVSHGKGAVYNKWSPGAQFEAAYKPEDRFATIGEYLQAIREEARPSSRVNRKELLQKLENVRHFQNSFAEEDPGAGGFLVPEIMRSEILQLALEQSIVRSRATVIPMSTLRVPIPTVDDTSHVSSVFGGIQFYWTEEAAALTESQATFGRVVLDAKKLTGFFKVPNELLADAPAFSGWFDSRIPAGLAWQEDATFLNDGTGVGEPESLINGAAYVLVSPASTQITWPDIVTMYSRMLPASLGTAVWIASIDLLPDLAQITLSTPGIWMGGYGAVDASHAPPVSIMGRPVIFTEKVPNNADTDGSGHLANAGSLSFVDLSYYLIGDRQAVAVSSSDQYAFANDQTAYRIIERVDGKPWLQSALTPHNNSGNTLSAYVGLDAAS